MIVLNALVLRPGRAAAQAEADDQASAIEAVHVVRYEPFSPFESVVWEIKPRGRSGVLALTRRSSFGLREDTVVDLIDNSELAGLLTEAIDLCPAGSEDIEFPVTSGELGWTAVVVVHADATEHVVVDVDPPDGPVAACAEFVRATILPHVDVADWTNPFWQQGEFGTLRVSANEVARIYIDGVDVELTTPLEAYPLEPGDHLVRWVSLDGERAKETTVRISAGTITRIDVELDPID